MFQVVARTPNAAEIVFHNWEKEKGPSYIFGRWQFTVRISLMLLVFIQHAVDVTLLDIHSDPSIKTGDNNRNSCNIF